MSFQSSSRGQTSEHGVAPLGCIDCRATGASCRRFGTPCYLLRQNSPRRRDWGLGETGSIGLSRNSSSRGGLTAKRARLAEWPRSQSSRRPWSRARARWARSRPKSGNTGKGGVAQSPLQLPQGLVLLVWSLLWDMQSEDSECLIKP